ncbi:MAG: hypothetical protein RBJ76_09685 [Stenomitos frigidus ULC029]
MSALTLPQTNGAKAHLAVASWQRDSVKAFFTSVNWDDHPPAMQEIKQSSSKDSNAPLSLKMSVCQFFATVNWADTAIAAPTAVQPSPPPARDELTLDDFSGLF